MKTEKESGSNPGFALSLMGLRRAAMQGLAPADGMSRIGNDETSYREAA